MSSLFGKFLTILGLKRREANILVVGLDNSGKSTILNYLKRKEDQVEEVVPTVGFTVERLSGLARNKSGISLTAFDMSGQGRYRNLWEHYYNNVEGIIFVVDSTDLLRLVVARDELEMMLKHPDMPIDLEAANGNKVINHEDNNAQSDGMDGYDDAEANSSQSANESNRRKNSSGNKDNLNKSQRLHQSNSTTSIGSTQNATYRRLDIPILFFANKMDLKEALPSVKISQMLGLQSLPHKNWHIQVSNAITGEGVQDGIEWLVFQIANNKKNTKMANSASTSSLSSQAK